jgi:Rrf2 family protein
MVNDISKENDIPRNFLAKILQKLAKAGLVRSFRGVKGGFQLSRRTSEITLLRVIEAIQGPVFLNKCFVNQKACSRRKECTVHPLWNIMAECVTERLGNCSIEILLRTEGHRCHG